ncbi:MAG TPA: hypothetical protein VGC06_00440 [Actinomycetes bacterium]
MQDADTQGNVVRVGGDVTGSAIAAGSGARAWIAPATIAEVEQRGADELAGRLRELEQALELDGERLGDASGTVREQVEAIAEELAKPAPRKSVAATLLQSLAGHARSATAVVTAVQGLIEAVHRLL